MLISLSKAVSPLVEIRLLSVMHGQCDGYLRLPFQLTPVSNSYCLVTEAHVFEQLAHGCTLPHGSRDLNPRPPNH